MSNNHKIIGIICAGIHDSGTQNSVLSLIHEADKRGYRSVVISNFTYYGIDYTRAESEVFSLMDSPVFDGLILMPESIKSEQLWQKVLEHAKASGKPFVCVDRDVPDCFSVTFSYGSSFEQVVRHMVEVHKPKRLNFIGGMENNSFSEERLNVFKKVLAENGREFQPERFGYGQFWEKPTLQVLDKFYNGETEPPDAIICVNDTEAMTCINYLRSKGIDVPKDVIVSGFDGIDEERYILPRLTTAACEPDQMSGKSFDMLEEMMAGKTPEERLIVIPYKLRVSQSCGCIPHGEADKMSKLMELFISIKNSERHERSMFEYGSHAGELNSYEQFARMIPNFCECPSWCCIDPKFLKDDDSESAEDTVSGDEMLMFVHCDNCGEIASPETYTFDIPFYQKELLPDLDKVLDKYSALLISPLSYRGNSMGHLAAAMDSEGFDFLFTQRLISNTNEIFETLKTKIRLQKAYAKVADMHMRDPMTGIYNRRGFYMRMDELSKSGITNFELFSIDLNRLKYINDTFGHYAGDKAIITTSDIISSTAGNSAVCARFGGDEFIVAIPVTDSICSAPKYMKSVEEAAERFNSEDNEPFRLSLSIGDACLKVSSRENIDLAMKAADEKMYECKRRHHAGRC
ncbi:MAG: GGDEF domain-containing protein [Ruminococcus sp.]|uniref:substrate-binding and GGDEF domain-containing protein n=1 Tax=Ruminococcus sp. TaxID=41978 RepID=UPI0025FF6B16|nr:GGDEF domain-containing protein [Ruminococcus sp.]MCR5541688.1 GGDEF domain-containing protein [Ruminococcus sp.]